MKNYWWKILAVIIMIYVITAGLLVPLKPGIELVQPTSLPTGQSTSIEVTGYNTFFSDSETSAYLRLDDEKQLKAKRITINSETNLIAEFVLPNEQLGGDKTEDATLIVTSGSDYAIYPVMRLVNNTAVDSTNIAAWGNVLSLQERQWRFAFPYRSILVETIRNTFFHVAIWMALFILLTISLVQSIWYLKSNDNKYDRWASSFTYVSIVYGALGILTGSIWGKFTWGTFWTPDVKLNMTAISMLIYASYAILRSSIDDYDKRAKTSAIYNIFAYCAMIPLIMIIPRLTASLHPGNGGNPAMGGEDLDSTLRLVFYPSIIGLALLGGWIAQLWYRYETLSEKRINKELNEIK